MDRWVRASVRQLLRLVRRPRTRACSSRTIAGARLRLDRGDLQPPPGPQGDTRPGGSRGGKVVFLMFDDETESSPASSGSTSHFRPRRSGTGSTRRSRRPASPTRPACRASRICWAARDDYDELRRWRDGGGLATTSSCRRRTATRGRRRSSSPSQADWDEHAATMAREELKVMRRINRREAAIEGVITRHGTLVGPLDGRAGRASRSSRPTAAAGAATTSRRPCSPTATARSRASAPAPWATGSPPRATAATSSSTSSPTSTPARCTSASSTRA